MLGISKWPLGLYLIWSIHPDPNLLDRYEVLCRRQHPLGLVLSSRGVCTQPDFVHQSCAGEHFRVIRQALSMACLLHPQHPIGQVCNLVQHYSTWVNLQPPKETRTVLCCSWAQQSLQDRMPDNVLVYLVNLWA